MKSKNEKVTQELLRIVSVLRSNKGCPWDQKQTHQSLTKYLEEEVWEVIDAIDKGEVNLELKEELGDILLQVVMHSQIAKEKDNFDFYDVVTYLNEKLIRRHPHVFDKKNVAKDFNIEKEWDKIKEKEIGKKYHPLERLPQSASLEYLFQKITTFKKQNNYHKSTDLTKLQKKIELLTKKTNNNNKLSSLLGEIFFALAQWANNNQIEWVDEFKKQLCLEKENILLNKIDK